MTTTAKVFACMLLAAFLLSCAAVDRIIPDLGQKPDANASKKAPEAPAGKKPVENRAEPAKPAGVTSPGAPAAGSPDKDPATNLLSPAEAEAAAIPAPDPPKKERREKSDASIFDSF